MNIGQWVKQARARKGWTQQQLADRLGRTKGNISQWENGAHEPSFGQLLHIRDITGHALHDVGAEPAWPLPRVPRHKLISLTDEQRQIIEAMLLGALAMLDVAPQQRPDKTA